MWEPFHGDWGDVSCSNPYYYVCEVEDGYVHVYYNSCTVILCVASLIENKSKSLSVIICIFEFDNTISYNWIYVDPVRICSTKQLFMN